MNSKRSKDLRLRGFKGVTATWRQKCVGGPTCMHDYSNHPNDQMDPEYASCQHNIHRNTRDFLGFCYDITLMTSL